MEDTLAAKVWARYQALSPSQRYIVGIAGIPGSGKSTLCTVLAARLNARHAAACPHVPAPAPIALALGMDGFHLTRAQLDGMPDPALAHTWRGADWTFDGQAYAAFVRALRSPVADAPPSPPHSPQPLVWAPSFDHAVKDPVPADIAVLPSHRIVLLEGNYTALDREPWRAANALLDERWFIHIDFEAATQRLIARHVAAGIAPDEILAEARARQIDLVNAADVVNHLMHIDELILSSNLMSQPTTPEVAISPLDE